MLRYHVFFFGRVQGVGFRYTCLTISQDFDVTGFVRNRADGSVELVAEGRADEIDAFLKSIRQAIEHTSLGRIDSVDIDVAQNVAPQYEQFSIAH